MFRGEDKQDEVVAEWEAGRGEWGGSEVVGRSKTVAIK